MKLLRFALAGVGIALVALYFVDRDAATRKATLRVERMMDGWLEGGTGSNGATQDAVFQWNHGTKFLPEDKSVGQASRDFDDWRRERNLYRKISSYRIEAVGIEKGSKPRAVRVDLVIDDRPFALRVVRNRPIEWIEAEPASASKS